MNIFGIEISFSKKTEGGAKFVKQDDCHEAHVALTKYLEGKFDDTNRRIDDFMNSVNNYIGLLKK